MKFRPLNAEEIEIRIDRVTAKGAFLLLYKNARVDMNLLDETVGAENWQRTHEVISDSLFCNVSIWCEGKGWVTKQDVGTESFTEKEKGEASDSFKRACTNWGIGRELYSAPDIFVSCETEKNDKGRYDLKDKYMFNGARVANITYKGNAIDKLAVVDRKGNVIWSNMGNPVKSIDPEEPDEAPELDSKITAVHLKALTGRLATMKYPEKYILEAFAITSLKDLTIAQFAECNARLTKIEEKRKRPNE
jgi:hypothetical protein